MRPCTLPLILAKLAKILGNFTGPEAVGPGSWAWDGAGVLAGTGGGTKSARVVGPVALASPVLGIHWPAVPSLVP